MAALGYKYIDLKTPGVSEDLRGFSDQGQVAGNYSDPGYNNVAFLYSRGATTILSAPGSTNGFVVGLNSTGQVLGQASNGNTDSFGYTYQNGRYTKIPAPPGARYPFVSAENDKNTVVGTYYGDDNQTHMFLYSNGKTTSVSGSPGGPPAPTDINNSGRIVGSYTSLSDGVTHGFTYKDGKWITVDGSATVYYSSLSIVNDRNEALGRYVGDDYNVHSFLATPHRIVQLDIPGYEGETVGVGLNNAGQVLEIGYDYLGAHSYVYDHGKFAKITIPGASSVSASDINEYGVVTGNWTDNAGSIHGFVWARGLSLSLDFPGASQTTPQLVNDLAQVAGSYMTTSGAAGSFVATPALRLPEFSFISGPDADGSDASDASPISSVAHSLGHMISKDVVKGILNDFENKIAANEHGSLNPSVHQQFAMIDASLNNNVMIPPHT
jgi:probable HAF family extracellular repeat protein